jgi:hypothetical protein
MAKQSKNRLLNFSDFWYKTKLQYEKNSPNFCDSLIFLLEITSHLTEVQSVTENKGYLRSR